MELSIHMLNNRYTLLHWHSIEPSHKAGEDTFPAAESALLLSFQHLH